MNIQQKKWLYLILLSLVWGSSFILMKKALIGLTPIQLGALRILIAGLFLLMIGFKSLKEIKKKHYKHILSTALLGTFFPVFAFAFAVSGIDSSITSILNSLTPFNTFIVGVLVFGFSFKKQQFIGIFIGLIGTVLLILKGADLNPDQNYWYAIFVILSTLMYATNVNIIKKYLQHVKPLTIATGNFVGIFIPAIIVLLFTDFFSEETFNQPDFKMAMVYITVLSFFGTALAKILFNKLVQMSTPVFASSVTYLMPIVALMWGFLDGETFSWLQAIASVIILLGVYLSHKNQSKKMQ